MKLTEAFFHGHNHIVTEADGMLTPHRLSKDRIAFYIDEDAGYAPRAESSSGISIEFETSADEFALDLRTFHEARNENSMTIYEDGRLAQIIGFTWAEPKNKLIYRKKNQLKFGKKCQYAIYLPAMAVTSVQNLSAEDATPLPKREKQLLTLGDSITQGVYAQASAHAYTTRLARKFGMELCNQGIGGYYFNPNAFEKDADPSIITIAYGINDINRLGALPRGEIAPTILKNAEACFTKVQGFYPDVPMVCLTPIWRSDFAPEQLPVYEAVTQGLLTLCKKHNITAVNGCEAFPHDESLFTDGFLHPNDDGFAVMADALSAAIEPLL